MDVRLAVPLLLLAACASPSPAPEVTAPAPALAPGDGATLNPLPADYPQDEAACVARSGRWAPQGKLQIPSCDLPTGDGGQRCRGAAECERACLVEVDEPGRDCVDLDVEATLALLERAVCARSHLLFGCRCFVSQGRVLPLCLD